MDSPGRCATEDTTRASAPDIEPFGCDVLVVEDQACVRVRGELDLATAPVMLRDTFTAIRGVVSTLTLDLAAVTFVDSSGLGALLAIRRAADAHPATLVLESVPDQARRVIEITGVAELLGLAPRS